jgi:hypothetical protein
MVRLGSFRVGLDRNCNRSGRNRRLDDDDWDGARLIASHISLVVQVGHLA